MKGYAHEYERVRRKARMHRMAQEPEPPEPTEAERARVQKSLDEYHEHVDKLEAAQKAAEEKRQAEATARTLENSRRFIERDWKVNALECPASNLDKDGRPIHSISFFLSIGWTIEPDEHATYVLVPPKKVEPEKRETRINEMGS